MTISKKHYKAGDAFRSVTKLTVIRSNCRVTENLAPPQSAQALNPTHARSYWTTASTPQCLSSVANMGTLFPDWKDTKVTTCSKLGTSITS